MNTHSSGYPQISPALWKGMEVTIKLLGLEKCLTQNMQDKQTQVRAGPASADGRLRETDGMVPDRGDAAAATHKWASSELIRARGKLSNTEQTWLQKTQPLLQPGLYVSPQPSPSEFCFPPPSWIRTASAPCLSSPLPGESFTKVFFSKWGVWAALPLNGIKGGGGSPLIIHLFCVYSLSLIPCLPPSLHSLKSHHFYFHSLPDPPVQHPGPFLHPSLLHMEYFCSESILIFHKRHPSLSVCTLQMQKYLLAFILTLEICNIKSL